MNLEGVKTMEVEIEGEDGSKFAIGPQKTLFGRGSGINTNDGTVSRRHVCFQLSEGGRVSFEVIGRNPIWVCSHKDQSLKLFRKFEKGNLEFGDRFSLSAKTPIWFHLSHRESESETGGSSSSRVDLDIDQIDLSQIDPVKEFGFLVIGHEFDQYPKGKIKDVKDWEWFLDEPSKDSDEDEGKQRRKMKRKKKKGKDNDEDEEWGGESEDDKDIVSKIRKGKGPRYSTRSKDSGKGLNRGTKGGGSSSTSSKPKKTTEEEEEEEEEEDDDETLGGFIVDDEDDKEEDDEEDEEDEFDDDDDDE